MNLSERTLTILKNFASINNAVLLRKGTKQGTISELETILVEATIDEDLPLDFGIYDLNQFLGNVTTLKDPDITFKDKNALIADDNFVLNYHACPSNLIKSPPEEPLVLDRVDGKFFLTSGTFQKIMKLAAMNNLPNLSVMGEEGKLKLRIHESKNDTSNYGTTVLGDHNGNDFKITFKTENLKMIVNDYDVEFSVDGFATFTTADGLLKYIVALEPQ